MTADKIEKRLKSLKDNDRYDFDSVVKEFDALRSANQIKLWSSVVPSFRRTSLGEVKMLTRGVIKEGTLDINGEDDMQTINFSFYGTLVSSMALSLLAACVIPDVDIPFMKGEVLRYVTSFSLGSLPFAFLGLGLSLPGLLQAGLIQARRALSPEYSERLVRHEAGHLLVGYAMGLPVDAYRADDPVRFAVQFMDPRPAAGAWRGLEHDDVDRLCAVSLAGVVAEAMRFGDGIGGVADLAQLQGWLSRASPPLNDRQQQDRVRWGCVAAYTVLATHPAALEELVRRMAAGRPVAECLVALEAAHAAAGPGGPRQD